MIKEATIEYEDDINNLGKLVNSNYKKLFPLERIIADKYEKMYIYLDKDVLSGFIHFIEIDETIEIVNIVVDKMKRKQGIGSKLLEYTMKKSSDNIKNIVLEVNTSNQE
ncbi:MAG: GNAT family N-acetyltransferase, partial [Mollicutes bacterium]|nr:GNAT family N-acetyltransferase [Mollicutes bacterium]